MSGVISRVSNYAQSLRLQQTTQDLQSQFGTLTAEVSSNAKASPSRALGAGAALIYQLHYQSDEQTALQTSMTNASDRLDTIQTALTSMSKVAGSVETSALNANVQTDTGYAALASEARGATAQIIGLLNTTDNGQSVFGGSNTAGAAMNSADAAGGPTATINGIVQAATKAKGGPLTGSDVATLLTGTNGIASVFDNTNSDPAKQFTGVYFLSGNYSNPSSTAADQNNAAGQTQVLTGQNTTIAYSATGDQPAFRDLLHGLALLGTLDAPNATMDDTAKAQVVTAATTLLQKGQSELTTQQGVLGATQSELQSAVTVQKSASTATLGKITSLEQADTYADATKITALQTQLQATYEITAQLSKLSFVNYMPA